MHSNIASTRLKKHRLLLTLVGAGTMVVLAPMANATSTWLSNWRNVYPDSLSDDNASCALCHNSISTSGSLNLYGSAVRSNGITGAQNLDSDGEGHSNLVEINADAQPAWTGSAPTGVVGDLDPVDVVVNIPPTADAGGPYSGSVGEIIGFDGTGSSDSDGSISSYVWNFGDGTSGSGSTTTHAYAAAGTYAVSLTVTDNDGDSDTDSTTATIIFVDTTVPPIADAGGDYAGTEGQPVALDGTGSSDPDGGVIVQYDWYYGDGVVETDAGATPDHTYASAGTYTIMLIVTDDEGQTDTDTAIATIGTGELPPIADAGGPYTADLGQTVTFDATASRDPDGTVESYDWNFGDGTVALDAGPTPSHLYANAGTFNVTLTVTDNDGLSDSDSATATITDITTEPLPNLPPEADAGGPYSGVEDVAVRFDGSGSSDPDGSIISYRWYFGDGTSGTGISPSHTYANAGTYTVTLIVTDNEYVRDYDRTSATITVASTSSDDDEYDRDDDEYDRDDDEYDRDDDERDYDRDRD